MPRSAAIGAFRREPLSARFEPKKSGGEPSRRLLILFGKIGHIKVELGLMKNDSVGR